MPTKHRVNKPSLDSNLYHRVNRLSYHTAIRFCLLTLTLAVHRCSLLPPPSSSHVLTTGEVSPPLRTVPSWSYRGIHPVSRQTSAPCYRTGAEEEADGVQQCLVIGTFSSGAALAEQTRGPLRVL